MRRKMGRSTGLEPATFGTTIQRSNQLSYDRQEGICCNLWGAFRSRKEGGKREKRIGHGHAHGHARKSKKIFLLISFRARARSPSLLNKKFLVARMKENAR